MSGPRHSRPLIIRILCALRMHPFDTHQQPGVLPYRGICRYCKREAWL